MLKYSLPANLRDSPISHRNYFENDSRKATAVLEGARVFWKVQIWTDQSHHSETFAESDR